MQINAVRVNTQSEGLQDVVQEDGWQVSVVECMKGAI